jgi:hypothetical protein
MKTYWWSRGIAPRILGLSTSWRWVVSFTPWPVYSQGRKPWYPLDRRLGGPQNRSGRGNQEKNSRHLPGLEPLIMQPVAQHYTTELSRFLVLYYIILYYNTVLYYSKKVNLSHMRWICGNSLNLQQKLCNDIGLKGTYFLKLTMKMLRMHGAIPLLPHTSLWHDT